MTCFKEKIAASYQIKEKEADAAPPTPAIKKGNYYHGTPTKENAVKIWKEGIKPDLSETPEHNISKPVAGRVYITKNIGYALIYALGGDFAGKSSLLDSYGQPKSKKELSLYRYGYLFVIPGSQFGEIHPDEDQVGKAIYENKLPWLTNLAKKHLAEEDQPDANDEGGYGALLDGVKDGDYASWIKAGKLLLPHLTDKQKIEIIKKYGNVAHEGILHPTEMWQIDRNLTPKLKKDGSNFFQLAKKITSI